MIISVKPTSLDSDFGRSVVNGLDLADDSHLTVNADQRDQRDQQEKTFTNHCTVGTLGHWHFISDQSKHQYSSDEGQRYICCKNKVPQRIHW